MCVYVFTQVLDVLADKAFEESVGDQLVEGPHLNRNFAATAHWCCSSVVDTASPQEESTGCDCFCVS